MSVTSNESAAERWHDGTPLRVGVSSCLLGREVRWDGGHKYEGALDVELATFVEWVPVCPELELGLGVPRSPLRLEGDPTWPRLVEPASGTDRSDAMRVFAAGRVSALIAQRLCGYVFKSRSPSCGLVDVPVCRAGAGRSRGAEGSRGGRGLFAERLTRSSPALPVTEEVALRDRAVRAHFVERICAHHRLDSLISRAWT